MYIFQHFMNFTFIYNLHIKTLSTSISRKILYCYYALKTEGVKTFFVRLVEVIIFVFRRSFRQRILNLFNGC